MNPVIIVQARVGSTRLPGKILKTVLGKTFLEYLLERLNRVQGAKAVVVATTVGPQDDPVFDLCRRLNTPVTRGSEQDVLKRYFEAATLHHADPIIRVTSDCPLMDPAIVDRGIDFYRQNFPRYQYVSNNNEKSYPHGMDLEVFSYAALKAADAEAVKLEDREHVSPFITDHPGRFPGASFKWDRDESRHRWTLDYPEDFALLEKIISSLYPKNPQFTLEDVLQLLKRHPDWVALNAHRAH